MSNEVKQRKKASALSSKEIKDAPASVPGSGRRRQDEVPGKAVADPPGGGHRSLCPELRTLLCVVCVAACMALTWHVFQQSHSFTVIEQRYHLLQAKSAALDALEDKVRLIFEKLVSTDDILAEATSSTSVVDQLQQQVSSLHNDVDSIQENEQALSKKMQNVNMKFQNITHAWKKSLDEMNMHTSTVKSEAKLVHQEFTLKINNADQTLKSLSEKLKDLEDSSIRNTRTLKRQEDDELVYVKEQLDWDTKVIEKLEKEQSGLTNIHGELKQNLIDFKPKLDECIRSLPTIENTIRTLLKVSNEMLDLDKKMNDLTVQVFNTEDSMLKTVSGILKIQHTLEGMQYDNSMLKMQNEISLLKEKMNELSSDRNERLLLEEGRQPMDGQN
ncbi:inhibitor of nuclear factor kappa-B kinase-interacting protein isoform X1 [Ascaphus truei]|uniref:inhibitor of nuclear factor kappa-B kinase-interacting protein isoform X1 n=1 Tax=Ascaphus truei TaxID=8439 RepID=UPI003F5A01F7